MSTAAALDWNDLDDKAVDTVRALAMDAVQKVGNGHPGTAMSLAPAAYLLFQKVMRHNPADPHWAGRDRFVLSAGHSSLTLYIQLFLGGWGLELEDLKALRTWGSKTPGHPEYGHTAGVETTTGPLGQGIGNAVGMAMAARRERGLLDPEAADGESPFDHHIYAICSDGDIEEGVSAEASSHRRHPAARQPHPDLRRQPDLDRGRHRHRVHRGRREALRGLRLARADRRLDQRRHEYVEDVPALCATPSQAARAVTDRPSFIVLRTIIAWPAPNAQNTGKAHGSALGADEVAATKKILGFDPEQDLRGPPRRHRAHPRAGRPAARRPRPPGRRSSPPGAERPPPTRRPLCDRMQTRTLPDGWADALPDVRRRPQGRSRPARRPAR